MEKRDIKKGTYNGITTYCTVNAYGDCPYCDQCNICHVDDPIADCDDFGMFFQYDWNFWMNCKQDDDETEDDYFDDDVDETGFNPFEGSYDYDC